MAKPFLLSPEHREFINKNYKTKGITEMAKHIGLEPYNLRQWMDRQPEYKDRPKKKWTAPMDMNGEVKPWELPTGFFCIEGWAKQFNERGSKKLCL